MRFVCVFEAVYVCVCAGQSKTGSIVKAFETLLTYRFPILKLPPPPCAVLLVMIVGINQYHHQCALNQLEKDEMGWDFLDFECSLLFFLNVRNPQKKSICVICTKMSQYIIRMAIGDENTWSFKWANFLYRTCIENLGFWGRRWRCHPENFGVDGDD